MQRKNLAVAVEPASLQGLGVKHKEGHQAGTFRAAQESAGAAGRARGAGMLLLHHVRLKCA